MNDPWQFSSRMSDSAPGIGRSAWGVLIVLLLASLPFPVRSGDPWTQLVVPAF